MVTKTMWLTKYKGYLDSYYYLWRHQPRYNKSKKQFFGRANERERIAAGFCARPFEKYCPELKMRVGEICQVEVKIKRKIKPKKAKPK